MTHRILIATSLSEAGLHLLRGAVGGLAQVVEPAGVLHSPLLATTEALIIRDEVQVNMDLLQSAPKLRVIGRAGADIAGIDVEAATRRGIVVMNTPGVNAISAAEYTFALLLALVRNIIPAHNQLTDGTWKRDAHIGLQLSGKTLGIIGFGKVGKEVAYRATAFGMQVKAFDPYVSEAELNGLKTKLVGLNELLATADIVTIHCAATPETAGLLNTMTFNLMKPGAFLINTAHGSIVNETALLEALDRGKLAGAAVDVFNEEPLTNSRLLRHPRILHTPHLGDSTREAQRDLGIQIAQQVLDALRGDDFRNAVNLPFMDGMPFDAVAPYLKLSERIGMLMYHLAEGLIKRVMIEFKGEEFDGMVKPMTVAFLKGLLAPAHEKDYVNYINAPVLAHEQGIFVTQAKGLNSTDYANIMSCRAEWAGGNLVMAGALFSRTAPHIVQIDQYHTDFKTEGVLVIIGSYDIPGVIGRVGFLLAENNINIASWQTGRTQPGGHTLSVLTLDEPMPEAVLTTLRQQDYIRHVRQVVL